VLQTVRPISKPHKYQVLTAEQYKAQRQQDLLKATSTGAFDAQAGQQVQQQVQQVQLELGQQSGSAVHPGALGMPAAEGLSLPMALPLEAAGTDAAAAFQQYLPPAGVMRVAAPAATAAPQDLLLPQAASLPALDGSAVPPGLAPSSSSMAALLAALAAAQRGSISDQLNMADDGASEQQAAALLASTAAAAAPGSSTAGSSSQPEVLGWVAEMSRESVLGQHLHDALSHAVRMQQPVMLPSGHKVFPDGSVVLCLVNNELGLMLPAGSQDLEVKRAQVAAAITAGIGSSSSMAAAAAGWGSADGLARVSGRAGVGLAGGLKDGSELASAATMLAAASAAAALDATGAATAMDEQLLMDVAVGQQ
jgi:hypothetical protein